LGRPGESLQVPFGKGLQSVADPLQGRLQDLQRKRLAPSQGVFAGLTLKEAAASVGIALRTAERQWAYARAWLYARLRRADETDA
jgi:hypothetical protein